MARQKVTARAGRGGHRSAYGMGALGAEGRPGIPRSTKEVLVLTAERLFATHGIDAVSLRQISAEAGNANNSAVQYHFGSKDRLVQAIFEYRIPHLIARRELLAAEAASRGEDDLRSALIIQFLPLVEQAEHDHSYYLSFVSQLQHLSNADHPYQQMPDAYKAKVERFRGRLYELLPELPPEVRWYRIGVAGAMCLHASSDRERSRHHGVPELVPYAFHVEMLFDALVGFLEAPVSASARAVLRSVRIEVPGRVRLP